ncbi:MAG: sugar ABC transporter permease [Micrococcales bacterium 70-64]|nr:sugar ABC transporter permease [Leifsonia sp.]ODU64478.1 MAG: sugar ABC transporter permease [Leifsonia sp. SCN 70-46]OJX86170.1 MAG: sugar ABC transporter permease [Micrococcales bacterium 70-64]
MTHTHTTSMDSRGTQRAGSGRESGSRPRKPLVRYGSWWWAMPALLAVLSVHYVATSVGGAYAFTDFKGIGSFDWIGFDNFVKIVGDKKVFGSIGNTIFLAISFLVITNVVGLLFALALNRGIKSRYILRTLLFLPVVLSPLAVSYIFRFIFQVDGPLNSVLGAIGLESWQRPWLADPVWAIYTILAVMVWQNIGMAMIIYLAGLATVPIEIEEAAAIDGASAWQRFRHITLPLIQPAVAISTTLALTTGLRVFDQVQGMTRGGPFGATDTLSTVIYRETFANSHFGYGAALSLIFTVIVIAAAALQLFITRDRNAASAGKGKR